MRVFVASAMLLAVLPAAAQATGPVRAERNGYTFEYVVTRQSDGSRLISGRDLRSDESFSLLVKNRRVRGEIGGRYVSFAEPRPRKATLIASK